MTPPSETHALIGALLGAKPDPHAVIQVATNHPGLDNAKARWIQTGYGSITSAAAYLLKHAGAAELYLAPAWFTPGAGRKKTAVISKRTICADIDDKVMPGSTPEERHRQARTLARAIPCPTMLIDSGGGFQPHVLLPEESRVGDFDDSEVGRRQVEILGISLRLFLEATALDLFGAAVPLDVTDGAERLWRVAPSWNMKAHDGAKTLTPDPARWRRVVLVSPRAGAEIALADLSFLIPYANEAERIWEARAARQGGRCDTRSPKAQKMGAGKIECGRRHSGGRNFAPKTLPKDLARAWPMRDGDSSAHDWAIASSLAQSGWHPDTTRDAIRCRRDLLGDPKGGRGDYVDRTVGRAYAEHAPRPLLHPLPAPVAFPLEALPPPLAEYLAKQADCIGCAVELIAVPYLTVLGAAIGNTRSIKLKNGWFEPPLLWTAAVSPSGTQKTPALSVSVDQFMKRQRHARESFEDEVRRFKEELATYKKKAGAWKKDERTTSAPPTAPERPVFKRLIVSDITLEGLIPILAENPRGVLNFRDELGGWLKSFNSYRQGQGGDVEQWLSIYNTNPIFVDRKTDREHLCAEHPFVAITGGIQPRILRRLLTEEFFDCGLAARLLLSYPSAPPRKWRDVSVSDEERQRHEAVLDRLLDLRRIVGTDGMRPSRLGLTPPAHSLWIEFYNWTSAAQARCGEEDPMRAALSKLEAAAARIALIVCLTRWAYSNDNGEPDDVQAADMKAGISFARYFAREAERIYVVFRESKDDQERRALVGWLEKHEGKATVRDLTRGPQRYRNNSGRAKSDLNSLVAAGVAWRRWVPPPETGGHSSLLWELRDGGDRSPSSSGHPERVSPPANEQPGPGSEKPGENDCAEVAPGGDGRTRPDDPATNGALPERVSHGGPDRGDQPPAAAEEYLL